MESKTATALGAGIVTVFTPLVFPTVPLALGMGLFAVAGSLFAYAGRHRFAALWKQVRYGRVHKPAEPVSRSAGLAAIAPAGIDYDPTLEPAELPLSLVKRLAAEPLHRKTLTALRIIATSDTPEFRMSEVIGATPGAETYLDVRGIWSGLTRRTRSILKDRDAELICWRRSGIHDDETGDYIDHIGRVSALTHASLRRYFDIKQA